MDFLFALTDMNLTADIVFILSGVHLVDHITGITVSVNHQQLLVRTVWSKYTWNPRSTVPSQ